MRTPHIGVVAPVYNEQECLPLFREKLETALQQITPNYDVFLVDDGSVDDSRTLIEQFNQQDPRWHGVFLARNFGHQPAISAGIAVARGDVVIVMDSDLQDNPDAIGDLVAKWQEGFDVVYAVRKKRKESLFYRMSYWLYYRLLRSMSQLRMPVDSGDFCLMNRRVVDALNALPESNRFVRGLRAWVGFRQVGIEVERNARASGEPKYNLSSLMRLAIDGIMDFSWVPLRAATLAGLVSIVAAFTYLAVILGMKLFGEIEVPGWTSVVLLLVCFGGMNLMSLGIIGEYLGRTYIEVKRRPTYLIASTTEAAHDPVATTASGTLFNVELGPPAADHAGGDQVPANSEQLAEES